MTILGIETTCDETAAAVVADGRRVLSNVVATQIDLHAVYRGVVPEIASRAHLESILPVIREAAAKAGVALSDLDAVAVAHRPGLIGSLLIGLTAAKTLAWSLDKPLLGIDHVQAHLYSPMLGRAGEIEFPAVGLVVSGGHTALYALESFHRVRRLGTTLDDAVGEAYDKVAAILNLGYPGGPVLDKLAAEGDPSAVKFPRTLLGKTSLDFSFSGLKTAVLYHVRGIPEKGDITHFSAKKTSDVPFTDVAASFQAACVDVLTEKCRRAIRQTAARSLLVGGGVSANRGLRAALPALGVPVYLPQLMYTTDNAAMTAGLAHSYLMAGQTSGLDLDALTHSGVSE